MIGRPTKERGLADAVLYVPTRDLLDEEPETVVEEGPPTAAATKAKRAPRRRKKKDWEPGEPLALYDGNEGLLVRTVLLRSAHYPDIQKMPKIESQFDVCRLTRHAGFHDQEHIIVLCVDRAMRVVAIYEAAIGPTSYAAIEARSVLKVMLLTNANVR